jgi:hypothetical protein
MTHILTILVILGIIFIPYFTGYLTTKYLFKYETESVSSCFLLGFVVISLLAFIVAAYNLIHEIIKITIQ